MTGNCHVIRKHTNGLGGTILNFSSTWQYLHAINVYIQVGVAGFRFLLCCNQSYPIQQSRRQLALCSCSKVDEHRCKYDSICVSYGWVLQFFARKIDVLPTERYTIWLPSLTFKILGSYVDHRQNFAGFVQLWARRCVHKCSSQGPTISQIRESTAKPWKFQELKPIWLNVTLQFASSNILWNRRCFTRHSPWCLPVKIMVLRRKLEIQSYPLNGSATGPMKYWTNKWIEPLPIAFYCVSTKMGPAKSWTNTQI